jgi:hypothetical protein
MMRMRIAKQESTRREIKDKVGDRCSGNTQHNDNGDGCGGRVAVVAEQQWWAYSCGGGMILSGGVRITLFAIVTMDR